MTFAEPPEIWNAARPVFGDGSLGVESEGAGAAFDIHAEASAASDIEPGDIMRAGGIVDLEGVGTGIGDGHAADRGGAAGIVELESAVTCAGAGGVGVVVVSEPLMDHVLIVVAEGHRPVIVVLVDGWSVDRPVRHIADRRVLETKLFERAGATKTPRTALVRVRFVTALLLSTTRSPHRDW